MTIIQSIIFGAIQGVGEFLPISSTAHLVLIPYFTGWADPGLTFDIALHVGTLIAVLAFFWKDWINIFSSALVNLKKDGIKSFKKELLFYLIIGTIPGVLFGLLFEKKAETIFRSPLVIATALILAGTLLYWADKKHKGNKELKDVTLKDSVIIGLFQALAIIPGISRSGITITAGLFKNFNRANAARFSFLLSTPIIMGSAILKLPKLLATNLDSSLLVGILASAIFGYLAIKYLLKFLEKYGYGIFFWYRLGLGIIIITFYLLK
ncbi:undecaprenyl-diphosphatase UppP [Candidatus Parcubacteria bacterium]|nr:undecaprenyl-diphosphatase UppP [Patescibacteria group bacterium]MBU4309724.1 undecaprenyl-diphosphatase UppP [Patescibacteria group bacterium]MBU4432110.1 undecaprenyl-diphosphatase UppP [Patescibacteria group bacterium]MBU4577888.1 undecaprenyl-diphosphatase UppP [Patescibacteria group bacterium]MCG2696601.1 undecaprenyl-diphosphatase UppP [Candidatus Parcubacteria bacterium]